MKKIPSLFKRDYEGTRLVYNELVPSTEWVQNYEGIPTRKWDGTSCLITEGRLYKRYELKGGKTTPEGFVPAQDADPVTGDTPGWVPVGDGPEDKWHRSAFAELNQVPSDPWTYELIGPRIQKNPHGLSKHLLMPHGKEDLIGLPGRDFDSIKTYFESCYAIGNYIEGIVWWRDPDDVDCEKVKIKAKDFGIKPPKK